MSFSFYIFLGFVPSVIWLLFYLRKDAHPESNKTVLLVFLTGMLLAPLAILLELLLVWLISPAANPVAAYSQIPQDAWLKIFLSGALIPGTVEEFLKYIAVRLKSIKSPAFDEPADVMIYCIIIGLGFAAVENILYLFNFAYPDIGHALSMIFMRFIGATLIHALGCGMIGYWLAQGIFLKNSREKIILVGLSLAIIFHTCYNYLITFVAPDMLALFFILAATLIIFGGFLVSYYFKKVKKLKSVCRISN